MNQRNLNASSNPQFGRVSGGETPSSPLALQLTRLRRALETDLNAVACLRAVKERDIAVERLKRDIDRQLERVQRAAVITLVGATGAGKSTLLNALVGAPVAKEGQDRPTTSVPVIYAPADADLGQLTSGLPGGEPRIERYETGGRGPWTEQVLIDAPDVNSTAREHRKVVEALAERSDVLVVVLHHQSIVEEASVSFVDAFKGRRRMIFVLGRADEQSETSRTELLRVLTDMVRDRWDAEGAPVLALSARAAQSQPETPGWSELCEALTQLAREGMLGGVRRNNALGTAAELGHLIQSLPATIEDDLTVLTKDVASSLEELHEKISTEVSLRLRLRRSDLASMLWSEAAKRWDGPGGWALRVGGMSSLGMGAGLLLARRNPLVAAGTALGGMAVSKLSDTRERRRVQAVDELFPSATEFEEWFTASFSAPRLRAGRLCGNAMALGLPTAELAAERIAPAVSDAWGELVQRDLPSAAESSAVAKLRFLFDLPVYVLGAWVVYQAVEGYARADYLGMDFLINTLLILMGYLFLVRIACRKLLSLRAGKLLNSVIERAKLSMSRATLDVQQDVDREVDELQRALANLRDLESRWRSELEGTDSKAV